MTRKQQAALVAILLLWHLNDLWNIQMSSRELYVLLDIVVCRMLPLAMLFRAFGVNWSVLWARSESAPDLDAAERCILLLCVSTASIAVDQYGSHVLARWMGSQNRIVIDDFQSLLLHRLDLSVGLLLVAITEEVVFRMYLPKALHTFQQVRSLSGILAAFIFATCHWGGGIGAVLTAFIIGCFLNTLYRISGSLLLPIIVHYVVNVADATGICWVALRGWRSLWS